MAELTFIAERVREVEKRTGKKARFLKFPPEHRGYHHDLYFCEKGQCEKGCEPGIYSGRDVLKALRYLYRNGNQNERQEAVRRLGYKSVRFTIHELLISKHLPTLRI